MIFHFTCVVGGFVPEGALRSFCAWGRYGVAVFFVISGFVIPFALHRAKYQPKEFGRFLLRRVVRLHPPYLATIALVLAIEHALPLLPGFHGAVEPVSVIGLLAHVFYLNDLVGLPWLQLVFWTLAIEVQYYLAVGIGWPLLVQRSPWGRGVLNLGILVAAWFFPQRELLLTHLPVFLLGILVFQMRAGLIRVGEFGAWAAVASLYLLWREPVPLACAAMVTAALIWRWPSLEWRPLNRLGDLSYSLYLVHYPIGIHFINISMRWPATAARICAFLVASLLALGAAVLMHRWVEAPAHRWSSRIKL